MFQYLTNLVRLVLMNERINTIFIFQLTETQRFLPLLRHYMNVRRMDSSLSLIPPDGCVINVSWIQNQFIPIPRINIT